MSSRKLKKRKTNSSIKSVNETPEVLVLPPKLLQKLGISLGNIDRIKEDDSGKFKDYDSIKENKMNVEMCQLSTSQVEAEAAQTSESSIMKTANLMKNSVLLSPTFSYSQIDLNINEDVVSSTISDVDINNTDVTNENNTTDSVVENTNHILENFADDNNESFPKPICKSPVQINLQEEQDLRTSQCFDKQNESSTNSVSSTSNIKYKISVISEEIIAPDKFMEWKSLHSPSTTLIPVPIDTVIRKTKPAVVTHDRVNSEKKLFEMHDLNSNEKELSNNKDSQEIQTDEIVVDERNMSNNILSINEAKSLSYLGSNFRNSGITGDPLVDSTEEDISSEIAFDINKSKLIFKQGESELKNENDTGSNICHGRMELGEKDEKQRDEKMNLIEDVVTSTPKNSNEMLAKVNKVAAYLKEYLQSKKDPLNSNRRVLQSKSHIQGVEKPGGHKGHVFLQLKKESNPKTYGKFPPEINKVIFDNIPANQSLIKADFNIDTNDSLWGISKVEKFCVCSDFGCFNYYDLKCYEHIHFWKRDSVECSPDVIFSIYNNDEGFASTENYSYEEILSSISDESSPLSNYICFHNFEILENEHSSLNITVEDSLDYNNKVHVDESEKIFDEKKIEFVLPTIGENKQNPKDNKKTQNISGEDDSNLTSEEDISREESTSIQRMGTKRKRVDSDNSPLIQFKKTRAIVGAICEEFVAGSKLDDDTADDESDEDSLQTLFKEENNLVVCGICKQRSTDAMWFDHIAKEHSYLAWKEGDAPLDFTNETVVHEHLTKMLDAFGSLVCGRCGFERKNTRKYLSHVNRCDVTPGTAIVPFVGKNGGNVAKCGVCQEEVTDWFGHIGTMHNYLACREGDHSVNFDDDAAVHKYLTRISKQIDGLVCAKCGSRRKYVKAYFDHLKICDGGEVRPLKKRRISTVVSESVDTSMRTIQCGVCKEAMREDAWIHHIQQEHNYLAWEYGGDPIDVSDKESVHNYLYNLSKQINGLVCSKCGCCRKYVKSYLDHINGCSADSNSRPIDQAQIMQQYLAWKDAAIPSKKKRRGSEIISDLNTSHSKRRSLKSDVDSSASPQCSNALSDVADSSQSVVKCGVCEEQMSEDHWIQHIHREHNYLAWKFGEEPLDTNNEEAVSTHLYNISKQENGLICLKCGCRRKYVKLYLSHIKICTGNADHTNDSILNSSYLDNSTLSKSLIAEEDENAIVKCGVCEKEMENRVWFQHIGEEHNYMAWKDTDSPLDVNDDEAVNNHLYDISKQQNGLICFKCGCRRKYVKLYLGHIKTCNGKADYKNESIMNSSNLDNSTLSKSLIAEEDENAIVKCGVCEKEMENRVWFQHIGEEHNYMAWKDTDSPIDLNDNNVVREYLYGTIQKYGPLTCRKCGRRRKYAKSYLRHISSCGRDVSGIMDTTENSFITEDMEHSNVMIKCGVCQKEMEDRRWPVHMQIHNYVAWKEGEKPLNTEDEQSVYAHLYEMSKIYNGLTCAKCNITKKYVKSYRTHVENCTNNVDLVALIENQENRESYECALCHEVGPVREFKSHALDKHYNVAWMVGDIPIDVKSIYAVEKYLKEYKRHKELECLKCGMTRASIAGFYAHIITCGKTEEEMELYKNMCEICNNKYLGVYKNQHMMMHRVQEDAKLRRLQAEEKLNTSTEGELPDPSGKRRAAQKAKNVIKNFTSKNDGTNSNDEEDYKQSEDGCSSSESDISSDVESSSEDVSETDGESNVSETENIEIASKSRRSAESLYSSTNSRRIPFAVTDPAAYIVQSQKDFIKTHLTTRVLFPQWLSCDFEPVPDAVLQKYMPPLTESCKVMLSSNTWFTYKLFEAKHDTGLSMFAGASIQGVCWVPGRAGAALERPYLAVNCHSGTDPPRLEASQLVAHPALIQIWDFKDMHELPSFVFGLAHDFGTVWSMDWCPSGVRQPEPEPEPQPEQEPEELPEETISTEALVRLGLLAIACSNGSAYIFSVPYPTTIVKNEKLVYKLKPVAELRLYRDTNRKSQATAINWSNQKDHACVLVGYSNGMTAVYDLNCDSPLLSCVEDGVQIYYPFLDDRPHTACITDVLTFPTGVVGAAGEAGGGGARWSGGASAASSCGAAAALGGARGERAGAAHLQLPATGLTPAPHWPAPLLTGNSDIITQAINEVEWWGAGRRLGSVSGACGCLVCARLAAFFPPLLKLMYLHPVFNDKRDIKVKAKLDMIPLEGEKISNSTAEKSTVPFEFGSYESAIKSYGIKFKYATKLGRKDLRQQKDKPKRHSVELFPLADVTSMAFCPVPRYHKRLALATHCGVIFVVNT